MPAREKRLPQPVRSDSLALQTYNILKEAIFAGKFQPGEPVRELHIARSLDISQATVREALAQLEQAGLVVRSQGRRTMVTALTKEEVHDRLSMRIALEELACLKAARLMEESDFAELQKLAKTINASIAKNDCLAMTLADTRFHHFIWERTGSPILVKTLDQLTTPLFAFIGVLHGKGLHNLKSGKRHEPIIDALRSRKPDVVRKTIRDHIEGSYRAFLESESTSLDELVQRLEPELVEPATLAGSA